MESIGWFLFLFAAVHVRFTSAEVFTAISDMETLLHTERALTFNLINFIKAEEERIQELKSLLAEYERIQEEAGNDASNFLANPINAYLLVKRLTTDLKDAESVMLRNSYPKYAINVTQLRKIFKFPTNEDLNGAAVALTRLQDTYKLKTDELADGVLLGKKYSRQLSAGDCFELGRQLYNNKDYAHAEPWFRQALKKDSEEDVSSASRLEVLEYLEFTTFKLGNVREASKLASQVLYLSPDHQRIKLNKENYERMLKEEMKPEVEEGPKEPKGLVNQDNELYKSLCRGEKLLDPAIESQLRCGYVHRGIPYLQLGPVKEEEALLNPRIVIYHDVLYDSEIATIKSLAQFRLKRASVLVHTTGESIPANYRIAKSAFIGDGEHPYIAKISRRIGLVTGLAMDKAEALQVVNYGIGGQYEPHNDHAGKENPNAYSPSGEDWGNRIATWLFYMTNVEAGGATVFPRLKVALWPRKGSAALWHNLLPSGEGDDRTNHASCPVLTGSKWVCNKWIHERNQEFRRPCRLSPDANN